MTREFQIIVLTPPGLLDPALAIATSRVGELGVLDLEYALDHEAARQAAAALARHARNNYGLKLNCQQRELLSELLANASERLNLVLLTGHDPQLLRREIETIHQEGRRVFLEATNLEQARLGETLGVDGVVAKGNEAGGFVGEETAFVLLQRLLGRLSLPVYAQGGIGLHTAAACYAAGAAGIVLDAQLALARESRLPAAIKDGIAAMDGSETVCLGSELGERYRIYFRPGLSPVEALRQEEESLATNASLETDEKRAAWRNAVRQRVGWADPNQHVLLLGQDAAFAAPLACRFVTVSGILAAIRKSIETHCVTASRLCPLAEGAPLAQSHGTRYPIVQGPMTRVSDNAQFALEIAKGGGLPFLALAMMRKAEVIPLLEETRRELGQRPWGVGILGFVSSEIRQEQLEAIRLTRPPFALIAGGRPDQARQLEQEGIPTYLHVPSPDLLKMFLAEGSRRFVFEGRECGGHVGPRSSFVLWETMINVLLEHLTATKADGQDFHILFAGGIHDALSSSMVAVLSAPLADLGVRVGVLMGTAYLFTREAVATRAIVPRYQVEALRGEGTVLLETGPGHVTRCLPTPYTRTFVERRRHLLQEKVTGDHLREELEALNLGRLRIAAKGIARHPRHGQPAPGNPGDPQTPRYISLDENEQYEQGMYMIGQVAALRDTVCTIEELHQEVSVQGSERLAALAAEEVADKVKADGVQVVAQPSRIAIVGMSCILPGAANLHVYWENILNKVDAITEIPPERFDWRRYFDPDRNARDKIYSRWGGFIGDVPFNPLDYGMPPNSVTSIEPVQLLMLEVVRAALVDAGYLERPFPRERTAVIVAAGGGLGDLGFHYGFRSYLPHFLATESEEVIARFSDMLPEWTEDSFPGILLNVLAGRVANRFDLGGPNFVVDAACGSSLAALDVAVQELESGRADMAIVGGADAVQSPFAFLAFSKTHALSPSGRCRPFDANADGIAISEGVAAVILKRLEDAERDGDRIYAVIQGIGASSDGKDRGLTAPRPAGQLRALRRAYAKAGISPATVGLIEAHGTGTRVGDVVEAEALETLLQESQAAKQVCAIGSVKSMIGHTKSTAGLAGLMKVALALYHKVLPPTLVDEPNPKICHSDSPLYVNSEARPWLTTAEGAVRRAGVSAFGFGGTNFHAVLEEYQDPCLPDQAASSTWPAELLIFCAWDRSSLLAEMNKLDGWLGEGNAPLLRDLAYTLYRRYRQLTEIRKDGELSTLAVVATSLEDLQQKLAQAKARMGAGEMLIRDSRGIYFAQEPSSQAGKVAFLFPGQGSQYPDMLRDLVMQFPLVREQFEHANRVLAERLPRPLSDYIFPIPTKSEEATQANRQALTDTRIAQPALGAAGLAVSTLLQKMGVRPDFVAGHSYGEIVALCQARVFGQEELFAISEARGRFMAEATGPDSGAMAAVRGDRATVEAITKGIPDLTLANLNSPSQTVISGPTAAIEEAMRRCEAQRIRAQKLPVACAFHSPLVEPARERLARFLSTVTFHAPQITVFSNTTGEPYPCEPEAIRELLSMHLARPVEFQKEIEAMYRAGARIFIEAGPRSVLSGLVDQILADKPHLAVAVDGGGAGIPALLRALGQLVAAGLDLHLEPLFEGRQVNLLDFSRPYEDPEQARYGPITWLVNGGRARPWRDVQKGLPELTVEPLKVRLADGAEEQRRQGDKERGRHGDGETRRQDESPCHRVTVSPRHPRPIRVDAVPAAQTIPAAQTPPATDASQMAPTAAPDDEVTQVMLQYQQLMGRFLETQKNVMLAYLNGTPTLSPQQTTALQQQPLATELPLAPTAPAMGGATADENPLPRPFFRAEQTLPEAANGQPPLLGERTLDEKSLSDELLTLVSERTGYLREMLDLDANLEADLGIDSIKRVEILGALRGRHVLLEGIITGPGMEQLQSQRTLRGIITCILAQTAQPATVEVSDLPQQPAIKAEDSLVAPAHSAPETMAPARESAPILRYRLESVAVPLTGAPASLAPGRVILITDDGRGIAPTLAEMLRCQGHQAVLLTAGSGGAKGSENRYAAELTSRKGVQALLDAVRQRHGPIGSLLHLAPLQGGRTFESMDLRSWRDSFNEDLIGLFHLMQALHEDLAAVARVGGACLLAATGMGGSFASDSSSQDAAFTLPGTSFPGHGGIAGLLKTAAQELPAVRVKVVDLDRQPDISAAAQAILNEVTAGDGLIEVGYDGVLRRTLRLVPTPVDSSAPTGLSIDAQSVILVTGGARGITALVAQELARRYKPTLVLVGRSPLPPAAESPQTAGLISAREIKAALVQVLGDDGRKVPLAEVEAAYERLLQEREMRANLAALQQAGARIEYHSVDVRDEVTFSRLIDDIYRRFGRLDGVIHGAGIVEDKLIKDKTTESFRRVIGTKLDSAFILSRKLRPETLKFLVFFSSISGRFGNRGQGDYAAANEVLNKLAVYLDRRWPARVVSINWGPWDAPGMVSEELRREFARRGVSLVPAEIGVQRLVEEINYGRKGEAEVLICGEDVMRKA